MAMAVDSEHLHLHKHKYAFIITIVLTLQRLYFFGTKTIKIHFFAIFLSF